MDCTSELFCPLASYELPGIGPWKAPTGDQQWEESWLGHLFLFFPLCRRGSECSCCNWVFRMWFQLHLTLKGQFQSETLQACDTTN